MPGKAGRCGLWCVSGGGARISWSPYEIFRRELTIKGSFAQTHCFDRALIYLESGKLKVDAVVQRRRVSIQHRQDKLQIVSDPML